MKKLYTSILILLVVLLTGCSIGTSVTQTDNPVEKETSALQEGVEEMIADDSELEEKINDYSNAVSEALNNIAENEVTKNEE